MSCAVMSLGHKISHTVLHMVLRKNFINVNIAYVLEWLKKKKILLDPGLSVEAAILSTKCIFLKNFGTSRECLSLLELIQFEF